MGKQYMLTVNKSSDLRRFKPVRRSSAAKIAARRICHRYGISEAHAKLVAELHYGGRHG